MRITAAEVLELDRDALAWTGRAFTPREDVDRTAVQTMADIEIPHPEGRKNEKPVGIIIAVVAVVLAVIGSLGNNAANDRIVSEVKASNGFAWYQAKRQREALNNLEIRRIAVELASDPSPGRRAALVKLQEDLAAKNQEYKSENAEILAKAEADRIAAKINGNRNDGFDSAEILLQIAVVLCTLTLLVEAKFFLRIGILVAVVGIAVGARTHFRPTAPEPAEAESAAPKP
jgi:hypothetical protein